MMCPNCEVRLVRVGDVWTEEMDGARDLSPVFNLAEKDQRIFVMWQVPDSGTDRWYHLLWLPDRTAKHVVGQGCTRI
jgi:hypothetical protein